MIGYLKKMLSILCVLCTAFSMTCCIHLKGTFNKTVYRDELKAEISKGNFVEEWTGDIPEGMKVKYVPVRDWLSGTGRSKTEHVYEYDSNGKMTLFLENILDCENLRREMTYNGDGLMTSIKQKYASSIGSAKRIDYDAEFRYDGQGRLTYLRRTLAGYEYEYNIKYDDAGHFVSILYSTGNTRTYQNDMPNYESCVILKNGSDYPEIDVVKKTYGEDGLIKSESTQTEITTYEYSDGKMTGYSVEKSGYVYKYDADGKLLHSESSGGNFVAEYTYNDHGDQVSSIYTANGEVSEKKENAYTYDSNGNMTSMTEKIWLKSTNKTTGRTVKYTYDSHGLLVTEEESSDETGFRYLKAYFYKAILVPEN